MNIYTHFKPHSLHDQPHGYMTTYNPFWGRRKGVCKSYNSSRYTDSKRILFLFIRPNAAGLHHLWVCKLTIMFCLQARKLPWTLSVIVKVFCFHSQATSEFKWIVLLLLWKVKLPEAWRKLDLITFQKMLISTGRQTHSGTFYLIIQFRSR